MHQLDVHPRPHEHFLFSLCPYMSNSPCRFASAAQSDIRELCQFSTLSSPSLRIGFPSSLSTKRPRTSWTSHILTCRILPASFRAATTRAVTSTSSSIRTQESQSFSMPQSTPPEASAHTHSAYLSSASRSNPPRTNPRKDTQKIRLTGSSQAGDADPSPPFGSSPRACVPPPAATPGSHPLGSWRTPRC